MLNVKLTQNLESDNTIIEYRYQLTWSIACQPLVELRQQEHNESKMIKIVGIVYPGSNIQQ